MRPAVSTSTTFAPSVFACLMAAAAMWEASLPYPCSKRETPRRSQWILSCSTAPERKVSQAAIFTLRPFCMSHAVILARLVLFPTPLTPTKTMLNGLPLAFTSRTSLRTSMCLFGVRMRSRADFMASCTTLFVDVKLARFLPTRLSAMLLHSWSDTSEATFFDLRWLANSSITPARSSSVSVLPVSDGSHLEKKPRFLPSPALAALASSAWARAAASSALKSSSSSYSISSSLLRNSSSKSTVPISSLSTLAPPSSEEEEAPAAFNASKSTSSSNSEWMVGFFLERGPGAAAAFFFFFVFLTSTRLPPFMRKTGFEGELSLSLSFSASLSFPISPSVSLSPSDDEVAAPEELCDFSSSPPPSLSFAFSAFSLFFSFFVSLVGTAWPFFVSSNFVGPAMALSTFAFCCRLS
mmetsp:Transcript_8692/g.36229  ORF Transcript_8692/g.36229 Transcript_8692/m.36229 type:complete len:410 (-) Transcript_8692:533-1762(-)